MTWMRRIQITSLNKIYVHLLLGAASSRLSKSNWLPSIACRSTLATTDAPAMTNRIPKAPCLVISQTGILADILSFAGIDLTFTTRYLNNCELDT
jgi:hypothetical protein